MEKDFIYGLVIYLPFFILFYYIYHYNERSLWKGKFIECLSLANGAGAFFMFITGTILSLPIRIDIVTLSSILITGIEATYTGKIKKPQKPKIKP